MLQVQTGLGKTLRHILYIYKYIIQSIYICNIIQIYEYVIYITYIEREGESIVGCLHFLKLNDISVDILLFITY